MAGERILEAINSRGGNDSDYADIVFGTVTSTSPLKIQISNQMTLGEEFLNLSENVTDHKVKMKIDDETKTVEILNGLKAGDGVTMIRQDGGQQFYVLEKTGGE